jgi:exo-beta-1,3-glucanase (GH17 family)
MGDKRVKDGGILMKSFNKVQGLSFSPYMDGQDPNQGVQIPESQLRDRMSIIAPYTVWVRSYAVDHGLEKSGLVAHDLGLKIALGAWLSGNLSANGTEIATLIECGRAGQADILVVGSETLQRGDLTDQQLIGYIHQVRQSVPDIAITTSDTYGKLLAYPAVIEAVDIVLANIYPFWESIPLDQAIAALAERYGEVKRKAGGNRFGSPRQDGRAAATLWVAQCLPLRTLTITLPASRSGHGPTV